MGVKRVCETNVCLYFADDITMSTRRNMSGTYTFGHLKQVRDLYFVTNNIDNFGLYHQVFDAVR